MAKTDKKERFKFCDIEVADWQNYTIHDLKENKVICHLLPFNGSEYCKEWGNKIVELLNNSYPNVS
jgi:hypothetical protein